MDFTVFFAWQGDRPNEICRFLQRDALKAAIKRIKSSAEIHDMPRLDHDTNGVSGTPEIADTILKKIDSCGIFVADLTFIGSSGDNGKKIPNPNVMFELGYAFNALGPHRIVCIMNEHLGVFRIFLLT